MTKDPFIGEAISKLLGVIRETNPKYVPDKHALRAFEILLESAKKQGLLSGE